MDVSTIVIVIAGVTVAGLLAVWGWNRRKLLERYAELVLHNDRIQRDLHARQLKVKQLQQRINAYVEEAGGAEQAVRDLDVRITQLSERLNEKWQLGRKLKGVVKLRKQNMVGLEAEIARWDGRLASLRAANKDWALQQDDLQAQLKGIKAEAFEQEDLVSNLFGLISKAEPVLTDRVDGDKDTSEHGEIEALRAHMQLLEGQLHYWQSKVSDLGFAVQDIASNDEVSAG